MPGVSSPRRSLILLVLLCVLGSDSDAEELRLPFVVSAGTHSLTVPWHLGPATARLNPVFMIGTERPLRPGDSWRLYQTLNIGVFQQHWWMSGVSIDSELGVGRSLPFGLHADLRIGLGYLHYFWRRESFELRAGRYVGASNRGRPSLLVPLSVVLGYGGGGARPSRISPFLSLRWAAQAVFLDEVPAFTHLMLLGGVRIEWGSATPTRGR